MHDLDPAPNTDDLWYATVVQPVMEALFANDEAAARAALAAAYSASRPAQLSAELVELVDFRLPYLAFQVELYYPENPGALRLAFRSALAKLEQPCASELAGRFRARYHLQLRCSADELGLMELDAAEFDALLTSAVELGPNAELWYYASGWAFGRRRCDVIAAALEYLTVHSTRYFADFLWQRVNLMHLLLEGRAARQDVLELIQRVQHLMHLKLLERQLWPACIRAGLVDDAVAVRWEAKRRELRASGPHFPRPARPTGSIRGSW